MGGQNLYFHAFLFWARSNVGFNFGELLAPFCDGLVKTGNKKTTRSLSDRSLFEPAWSYARPNYLFTNVLADWNSLRPLGRFKTSRVSLEGHTFPLFFESEVGGRPQFFEPLSALLCLVCSVSKV